MPGFSDPYRLLRIPYRTHNEFYCFHIKIIRAQFNLAASVVYVYPIDGDT